MRREQDLIQKDWWRGCSGADTQNVQAGFPVSGDVQAVFQSGLLPCGLGDEEGFSMSGSWKLVASVWALGRGLISVDPEAC